MSRVGLGKKYRALISSRLGPHLKTSQAQEDCLFTHPWCPPSPCLPLRRTVALAMFCFCFAPSVPLLAYLVPILARAQSKDSVTKGVKRVAEVRALKTMAVQHFQSMEHPSNGEASGGKAVKGT